MNYWVSATVSFPDDAWIEADSVDEYLFQTKWGPVPVEIRDVPGETILPPKTHNCPVCGCYFGNQGRGRAGMTEEYEEYEGSVRAIYVQPRSEGVQECVSIQVDGGPKAFARFWPTTGTLEWGWVLGSPAVKVWDADVDLP